MGQTLVMRIASNASAAGMLICKPRTMASDRMKDSRR
jgi:hypothetical protein